MTPGFTTHESSHGRKQKKTLNTSVRPWEVSDTFSELQMSANEHPQNLVSGDKISQASSKEPIQFGRGCTPK